MVASRQFLTTLFSVAGLETPLNHRSHHPTALGEPGHLKNPLLQCCEVVVPFKLYATFWRSPIFLKRPHQPSAPCRGCRFWLVGIIESQVVNFAPFLLRSLERTTTARYTPDVLHFSIYLYTISTFCIARPLYARPLPLHSRIRQVTTSCGAFLLYLSFTVAITFFICLHRSFIAGPVKATQARTP
jgi:hypothetical protein